MRKSGLMDAFLCHNNRCNSYFIAWESYDLILLKNIFDKRAKYIVRRKKVLDGIEAIVNYWRRNADRQENLKVVWQLLNSGRNHEIVHFSAVFYDNEERLLNIIDGQIIFKYSKTGKIIKLSETYSKTNISGGMPNIVFVSGKIASGKTTIATELAKAYWGTQYSISDYLKEELKRRGIDSPNRTQLQDIGEQIMSIGWGFFADEFLEFIKYDPAKLYFIDGLRHKELFDAIKIRCQTKTPFLIFISASETILRMRLNERGENSINYNRLAEGNLKELYECANLRINNSDLTIQESLSMITKLLSFREELSF